MLFLSLQYIKAHSRICTDCEDSLLELYGNAAEKFIFNYCNRSYEDIIETYGEIPEDLKLAGLMLVDASYQYRSPISSTNLYVVPYGFDAYIKPYMVL